MSGWYTITPEGDPDVRVSQVIPYEDLVAHDTGDDASRCVCGPRVISISKGDVLLGWVIHHMSLDGREVQEGENPE